MKKKIGTKNNRGRPKKTLKDLPEGWEDAVIKAGKSGCSDIEIRVEVLGISNDLWGRFMDEEAIFSETITHARELSKVWWVKHSRKELHNKEFNNKLYEMNMMNRFGWNKKIESENKNTHEVKLPSFKWGEYNSDKED